MVGSNPVQAGTAAVRFVKRLAEVARAGVSHFQRRLRDVKPPGFQQLSRFLQSQFSQILRDGDPHFLGECPAEIKMAAACLPSQFLQRRGIGQILPQKCDHMFATFSGEALLPVTKKIIRCFRQKEKERRQLQGLALEPNWLCVCVNGWVLQAPYQLRVLGSQSARIHDTTLGGFPPHNLRD